MSDPWQKPEVGFEHQFVKIQIGRFQKTILEVVEVEEHTVYIEFWLRIAVLPINPLAPRIWIFGSSRMVFLRSSFSF